VTIGELNAADRRAFVAAIGWAFEHSPWVAERAWSARPFRDLDHLHATLAGEMHRASPDEQVALLRSHPDIGGRAGMSEASTAEQAGAGLDRLTTGELDRLQQLNAAYRDKFGFPFLYAVKGSTTADIVAALEQRLPHATGEELAEALRQVARIARFRLETVVDTGKPEGV
jgi:2-oxo-4-hydroxy-4-carboxy-5-ureidoimidazoline decarboxylase